MNSFKKKIFVLLLFISFLSINLLKAQNYNISVLPLRVGYYKRNLNLYYFFKYGEIERRIGNNYSVGLGVYYSKDKEKQFAGSYRQLLYKFEPTVKYYLSEAKNMSKTYLGSGISYSNLATRVSGRVASSSGDTSIIRNVKQYLDFNIVGGYKFVFLRNRFLLNLEIVQPFNLVDKNSIEFFYSDNRSEKRKSVDHRLIFNPYLSLKLGYRFGFKK